MKQFSHLIHSHPLFILLGETETLGFSPPGDPIYSHERKNAKQWWSESSTQQKHKGETGSANKS